MTFANPEFLALGVGLALLVVVALWSHARRRRQLAEFLGGRRAGGRLSRSNLYRLRLERMVLLGLGALALAAAAAEPQWRLPVEDPRPLPTRSVVIAIDISASMQATDVSPTRLARAVSIAGNLIGKLEGDRVGLVLFAGTGYSLAPPTRDHHALEFLLQGVTPTLASVYDPGTMVSAGIREAAALLPAVSDSVSRRVIVLVTDGEAGEREPAVTAAAQAAVAKGIEIYTIGVGTALGAGMVLPDGSYKKGGPVVDAAGLPVISRLREPLLRRVAGVAGGTYARAVDRSALGSMSDALTRSLLEPKSGETPPSAWARLDLTFWLSVLALLCLLLESLLDIRLPRALVAVRRAA